MGAFLSRLRLLLVLVAVIFGLLTEVSNAGARPDFLVIKFSRADIIYNSRTGSIRIDLDGMVVSYGSDWVVKQPKPHIFHLMDKRWYGFYIEVDTGHRKVFLVTGGTFGTMGGRKKALKNASVKVVGDGKEKPEVFFLRFTQSYFLYEMTTGRLLIRIGPGVSVISKNDGWDIKSVGPGLYHIRYRIWRLFFWEVDINHRKAYKVTEGVFGLKSEKKSELTASLQVPQPDKAATPGKPNAGIKDFTLSGQDPFLESNWIESEKALYRELLSKGSFDVLVLPFQVQGSAIDRIGRSLMARYLSYWIESSSDLKVPDPTLVARALGERARTFVDSEIYSLANELKVKVLIRGYVSHNRDEKLKLTILVQTKDQNRPIGPQTEVLRLDWQDIPFSDEHPPEEAFYDLLNELVSKLPISGIKRPEERYYKKEDYLKIPETISAMVKDKAASPVLSAYYLQFLGLLYPEDTTHITNDDTTKREHFFERSLVALCAISPESPDYALLKARALFYLHRRPAALKALGTPDNAEEKAFAALLNGNMVELERWTRKINSPLHRLLAQIELNDLRHSYDHKKLDEEAVRKIAGDGKGWEMLITRRLEGKDVWYQQSNLVIKQKLDEAFPIPGFTAEDIIRGKMALGEFPFEGKDVDLSVYRHYSRILKNHRGRYCCISGAASPVERDYLDILYAVGEANLLKKVFILTLVKGLEEKALETLRNYEEVYSGHVRMTYYKIVAMNKLAKKKKGASYRNLLGRIRQYKDRVCLWSQGQTDISKFCCMNKSRYNADYPGRSSWRITRKPLDRYLRDTFENYRLAVLYTHNKFGYLQAYHNQLVKLGRHKEADALLEVNQNRFVGDPQRITYLAKYMVKKGDIVGAENIYKEGISMFPDLWDSYRELGFLYIEQGDYKRAFELFKDYPLFKDATGKSSVQLSHFAFTAGNIFLRHGEIDKAMHFLRLSESYQTGSSSEMLSSAVLALFNQDYPQAALLFRRFARRYNNDQGYMFYMMLLHLMGYGKESWALFNASDINKSPTVWHAAFVGHRMDGTKQEEQKRWLMEIIERSDKRPSISDVEKYLLLSGLIDRPPAPKLAEMIDDVYPRFTHRLRRPKDQGYGSPFAIFADGYFKLRKGDIQSASVVFNDYEKRYLRISSKKDYRSRYIKYRFAIPYLTWTWIKTKNFSEAERYIETVKNRYGEDFYYHLSRAFLSGATGDHAHALKHLYSAKYKFPKMWTMPIFPWYQLVQACEWLYSDTGYEGYKNLALKLARAHQRILPMYAWAYAVEAKYTGSDSERTRALALTLYLDKYSEHIAGFSKEEKEKALEWLDKNNPFLKVPQKEGVEQIAAYR